MKVERSNMAMGKVLIKELDVSTVRDSRNNIVLVCMFTVFTDGTFGALPAVSQSGNGDCSPLYQNWVSEQQSKR